MPGITFTNEDIDLEQLHPAYIHQKYTHRSTGSSCYEIWKHYASNNDSSPESFNPTQSRPDSVHGSSSRRSSIVSNGSRLDSFEIPITHKRLSYPLSKQPTGAEVIIDFDGKDDPYRPINWPFKKKVITTILYGFTTCWVTFASAIYSAGVRQIADDFNVTTTVSTAGISMVVFGFGLGPLLWAPLSEVRFTCNAWWV